MDRRTTPAGTLIFLGWCLGVLVGGMAVALLSEPESTVEHRTTPDTVLVEVSFPFTVTPAATMNPTSSVAAPVETDVPAMNFCGSVPMTEGQVCRMPMPTASITATMVSCFSAESDAGKLCQIRSTPTTAVTDPYPTPFT